jgi:hypothetical protein
MTWHTRSRVACLRLRRRLLLSAACLATGAAFAADPVGHTGVSYELGLTHHDELYEEFDDDGSKFMQESASMYGVKAALRQDFAQRRALKAAMTYAEGEANYIGALQGGEYGELGLSGLSRELFETALVYEQGAWAERGFWRGFVLHAGLGYRRLVDNLQDAGPSGYKRINERVYTILGVAYEFQLGEWGIAPTLDFRRSLWSEHVSELPLVGGGTYRLVHEQEGTGGEASLMLVQKIGRYPLVIRPFYRWWEMDASNVVYIGNDGYIEPRNTTSEVGLDISLRF